MTLLTARRSVAACLVAGVTQALALAASSPAFAAGSNMPWEAPLQSMLAHGWGELPGRADCIGMEPIHTTPLQSNQEDGHHCDVRSALTGQKG